MGKNIKYLTALCALTMGLCACVETLPSAGSHKNTEGAPFHLPKVAATNYWYQGKAELSVYDVKQDRYGEIRAAEQVNIYVTEDFSRSKQVKLDNPQAAGDDRCPVLKLNAVRKFKTGIYDYSVMSSVFSPMDGGSALKTTTSVQDWCGHVFAQFNQTTPGAWNSALYSYFEMEGDAKNTLKADYLEDELWTMLRIDPRKIKKGPCSVVPGMLSLRFKHKPIQPEQAQIDLTEGNGTLTLQVRYTSIQRSLTLVCEAQTPWRILNWTETGDGKTMSEGTIKSIRMEPYWEQNSNTFQRMRDSLNLRY